MTAHRRFADPVEAMAQRVAYAGSVSRLLAREAELTRIPPDG